MKQISYAKMLITLFVIAGLNMFVNRPLEDGEDLRYWIALGGLFFVEFVWFCIIISRLDRLGRTTIYRPR